MEYQPPSKYFEIDIFSHHFVVRNMSSSGQQIAKKFARNYIQYGWEGGGRNRQYVGLKTYAAYIPKKNEIRFHIGQYKAWRQFLADTGVPDHGFTEITYGFVDPEPLNCEITKEKTPRDYQDKIFNTYLKLPEPSWRKFVGIDPGRGKAVKNSTLVRVPYGWKPMGEIKVGDYVVAADGTMTMVENVYPQGKLQLYKITFGDGRTVECCGEHLWKIYFKYTDKNKRWRVVNTHEMIRLLKFADPRLYIPLVEPEIFPDVPLPIEPYLLGVILGDGSLSGNSVVVSKTDDLLFDNIRPLIGEDLTLRAVDEVSKAIVRAAGRGGENSLINKLRDFDLMGKRSWEKSIPEQYLNSSSNQRLKLLQGLMDTDGTANKLSEGGSISYCSTSEQLAKDVQYLVRSLGGMASISVKNTKFTYKGEIKEGRTAYNVNIRFKYPSKLFTLPRKKERTNDTNQYADGLKLRVVSIEEAGIEESTCISVDNDDKLFVIENFVVTHNTFLASWAAAEYNFRIVGFLKPLFLKKWPDDLVENLGMSHDDIISVSGAAELMDVITRAKNGNLTEKAILISNRTYMNYIKLYEEVGDDILNMGYDCTPAEFCQVIRAGTRIIDEVHEEFYSMFKIDLYTHIPRAISLSATLEDDDEFTERMYKIAYPIEERCKIVVRAKYIYSYALRYRMKEGDQLATTERGSTMYSHIAFEKNFYKSKRFGWLLDHYLELINLRFEERFLTRYDPGEKCLIYAASIEMCTIIVDYLKEKHRGLDVRRYVEKDPYANLMNGCVCVSTLGSAGTGHDIKGLITVLMTASVKARKKNIQGPGRLRETPGNRKEFEYLTCMDVPKQVEYHFAKEPLLAVRMKECNIIDLPYVVGES